MKVRKQFTFCCQNGYYTNTLLPLEIIHYPIPCFPHQQLMLFPFVLANLVTIKYLLVVYFFYYVFLYFKEKKEEKTKP